MAKRFTDTEKWKKPFIKKLPPELKLLWYYIIDDCDIAGLWIVDLEIAEIRTGCKYNINEVIKFFGDSIIQIDNGEKWFIPSFIEFQYGLQLSKTNNIFKSIDKVLSKYNLYQFLTIEITEEGTTISSYRNRISSKVKDRVLTDDEFVCQYCSNQFLKSELVVDHFIPLNKGGNNADENLICSCVRCNAHKTDSLPDEFLSKPYKFLNPTEKINYLLGAYKKLKGSNSALLGTKDKDKDKDKDMDKEKDKDNWLNINFDVFWDLYDKKVGEKQKLIKKWESLKDEERELAISHIPKYKIAQPDKKFRKDPQTYLNNKSWNDEIILENGTKKANQPFF